MSSLLGGFAIVPSKPTQKWGQICWKSVQLVRGSSFQDDLLQNPYFSDRENVLKFEAEGQVFAKYLRSLEQFIQTVEGQNKFW